MQARLRRIGKEGIEAESAILRMHESRKKLDERPEALGSVNVERIGTDGATTIEV